MVNSVNNSQIQRLSQLQEAANRQANIARNTTATPSFQEILGSQVAQKESAPVKFSSHAEKRLQSRDIELTPEIMQRLNGAMTKAREKGANETLMIFDNFSLIVSVKNNTVITAVDKSSMQENVFTNIDSAVFA
ncbi:MAG: flagellar protein [Spirochaetia bacterium]|nr:flagellar protein [Spirochaetia bacterium]